MRILSECIANPNGIILKDTAFSIKGDKVFVSNDNRRCADDIVVENAIAFPGLINIHDHLKYAWYKRTGKGTQIEDNQPHYNNVYEWLEDLYKTFDGVFNSAGSGLDIMFQVGLYKQIFSATTTVLNHSRHSKDVLSPDKQYISIVENIESELLVQPELILNVTDHALSFGKSIRDAHRRAISANPPKAFMIHVAEGSDEATKNEIAILDTLGVLTPQSILVHCINTDMNDVALIAKNKCTVVWCPYTSNFVIGKIADIQAMLSRGINLCIATDSSCSGSKNLLAELRYAQQRYKERFGVEISASDLFNMVTYNPAKALMLENKIGAIADEFYADIAIVDKKSENPYDDILSCNPENIIALWSKGHFVFGDERFFKKVSTQANGDAKYTAFKMRDREKIIIGNPKRLIQSFVRTFNINEPVLFDFIPKELQ